jgi:hypothetical protein
MVGHGNVGRIRVTAGQSEEGGHEYGAGHGSSIVVML